MSRNQHFEHFEPVSSGEPPEVVIQNNVGYSDRYIYI